MSNPVESRARAEGSATASSEARGGWNGGSFRDRLATTSPPSAGLPAMAEGLPDGGLGRDLLELGRNLARGEQFLDRAIRRARRGDSMGHQELLALQAGIHRHTYRLELASKLIDKAAGTVRQTLQSQS